MEKDQIRVIAIFAHPDDAEVKMGGTAARFAEMGHAVKFLSLTNGDAGHHELGGGALARVRKAEAAEAASRLGIDDYEILNVHDAELTPSLEVRHQVIRKIREWKADIVIGLRPNDYHPDHRYAGQIVMDAAYLVVVPNVVPDTPPLEKNPLFLYMQDEFQKPWPLVPDLVIGIDDTFSKKLDALDAHPSQFYEWLPWVDGVLDQVPDDPSERRSWLVNWMGRELSGLPSREEEVRDRLRSLYGSDRAAEIEKVEVFEIAEYGHQPTDEEILDLFPMIK